MDRLRCLEIFAEVAPGGSFTAAAQRFAISRSAVSKHVAWLEQSLGAQLLARTTKEVGLTDAGRRLLEGSLQLLERFEEIQGEVRDSIDICVVYPARDNLPKRVRAFLEHLREWARSPPDWAQAPESA